MLFSSVIFIFFYLPLTLAAYYALPAKWRNIWLFAASLIFYFWGEPDIRYIVLLPLSITLNYVSGIKIDRRRDDHAAAKRILLLATAINLALLIVFKYSGLIVTTLKSAIPALSFLSVPKLGLPIGISFYTFKAISYNIDVYRGDAEAQKNYISFGNFVALFPQLISGPIARYKDVAGQLGLRPNDMEQFASGVRRFTIGLAKKVLLANNVGVLWDMYSALPSADLTLLGSWLGIFAFALQLYFDFSGYSDMAIGLGRMIGFEFPENFDYPYISRSITEFWRRWHISLGSWFRDYVYIPMGGNRRGIKRQLLNILVVWMLTGIWHGADWTFLLWGLYYAFFLTLEKLFLLDWIEKSSVGHVAGHIYTLLVVICGWVLFQLNSLSACASYLRAMFGGAAVYRASDLYYLSSFLPILIAGLFACTRLGKNLYNRLPEKLQGIASPLLIALVLFISTAYLVDASYSPFLYFVF